MLHAPIRGALNDSVARSMGLGLAFLWLGCGTDNFGNPMRVSDTNGVVFAWRCQSDGCDPSSDVAPTVTCGTVSNDGYSYVRDRFVSLCPSYASSVGWSTVPAECRVVTCEHSSECPRWDNGTYVCEAGLCQREGHAATMRRDELRSLCLADRDRDGDCGDYDGDPGTPALEAELDASCGPSASSGSTCTTIPAGCRAP